MDEVREGSKHDEEVVVVVAEGKGKRSSDKGLSDLPRSVRYLKEVVTAASSPLLLQQDRCASNDMSHHMSSYQYLSPFVPPFRLGTSRYLEQLRYLVRGSALVKS